MTAEDLKRKVQAGEDPSVENKSEDVTVTGEDMEDTGATTAPEAEAETSEEETPAEESKEGDADGNGDESPGETAGGTADAGGSDEADSEGGDAADGTGDDGKRLGKRKKKKEKKDPRDEKIAELNDRLLRNLAEFENFRNRSEKEKEARFDMGARSVVEKILPVVDNLERGLDGLSDEERESPFAKGIEAVYKQLMTAFTEMGVAPIEAVGQEFNPDFHQAVMHEEDDSDATNQVVEELQKGYTYKDTVVRYSMVKVLN